MMLWHLRQQLGLLPEWTQNLHDLDRQQREENFQPAPIRLKWVEHLSGVRNWQFYMSDVLMFQAWLQNENV